MVKQNSSYVLGNDTKIRFWEDKWWGEASLCDSFPLYGLTGTKGFKAADVWVFQGDS